MVEASISAKCWLESNLVDNKIRDPATLSADTGWFLQFFVDRQSHAL
jgi:hypothetical protein